MFLVRLDDDDGDAFGLYLRALIHSFSICTGDHPRGFVPFFGGSAMAFLSQQKSRFGGPLVQRKSLALLCSLVFSLGAASTAQAQQEGPGLRELPAVMRLHRHDGRAGGAEVELGGAGERGGC